MRLRPQAHKGQCAIMRARPFSSALPPGMHLLERGWLSSNNVLLVGQEHTALIDSGYASHAPQTLRLVQQHLGGRPLRRLVNTHLHSDHCGGNALLQAHYPEMETLIAPGESEGVMPWRPDRLTHAATGQRCEAFSYTELLRPGESVRLGDWPWLVLSAPGHDPHAVMLWNEAHGVLISADALWDNGFGIVFPELTGQAAFGDVRRTLERIADLSPRWVLPGHGGLITDVTGALTRAHSRLNKFEAQPASHSRYAIKALLKFLMLDWRQCEWSKLCDWVAQADLIREAMRWGCAQGHAPTGETDPWPTENPMQQWLARAVNELLRQGQLRRDGLTVLDH